MANPLKQYVWDLRYIDAPVLRWRDQNTDGTVDDTLYSLNDANMNVTAVVDASDGDVVERYAYDPYGRVTVLNGEDDADGGGVSDGSADADDESDWDNRILYRGYRLDPETGADGQGIMHVRHRPYHCTFGRWTVRDFEGYVDGSSLYQYAMSSPLDLVDWLGLAPSYVDRSGRSVKEIQWIVGASQTGVYDGPTFRRVTKVQSFLLARGYLLARTFDSPTYGPNRRSDDGRWGPRTDRAYRAFVADYEAAHSCPKQS